MWKYVACMALVLGVAGCGSEAQEKMGGEAPVAWPEADALDQALMEVAYPAQMNDWGSVKAAASGPAFQSAVDAFASAATPEGRDDAKKTACVDALKALMEAAKSGSNDDLKTKYQAAMDSLNGLRS